VVRKVADAEGHAVREAPFEGPWGYANWRAYLRDEPYTHGGEVALYSDARFTGEIATGLGPFQVLHTLPLSGPGTVVPVFALRVDQHISAERGTEIASELLRKERTILDHYHGGGMYDEVAALLSLSTGTRLKAGPETRTFDARDDPRGRFRAPDTAPPVFTVGRRGPVIPSLIAPRAIETGLLPGYPHLVPADALALVRAARSYQEAVWIADGDPQLAWLLLVSAVETAAARWFRATNAPSGSDAEVLRAAKPDLADALEKAGRAGLVAEVAREIAQGLRAGYKFREFLVTFARLPPEPRPNEWGALDWSPSGLKKALTVVYGHRSKALHESVPFPVPMCSPPMSFAENGPAWLTEKPGTGGMFAEGGLWELGELPMLLWVFERLARGALLNWWDSAATIGRAANSDDAGFIEAYDLLRESTEGKRNHR
jgi:hypothetical protein